MHSHCEPTDLGKLVENNWWSNILGGKPVDKQLAENAPAENSSQKQKIISNIALTLIMLLSSNSLWNLTL